MSGGGASSANKEVVLKQARLGVMRGRILRVLLEKGEGCNELGATTHRFVLRVASCGSLEQAMDNVLMAYEKGFDMESPEMAEFLSFIQGVCRRGYQQAEDSTKVREATDFLNSENVSFFKVSEQNVGGAFAKSGNMCVDSNECTVESKVCVHYVGDSLGSTRFRCLVLDIPQNVRKGNKCFYVESLVRRGKGAWKCPMGSIYGKRHVDGFGMVPCSMLYVENDCLYCDRRRSTIRDHGELMRSIGCGSLLQKGDRKMTRNMDAIAWSSSIDLDDERVEFVSIFTPMFW